MATVYSIMGRVALTAEVGAFTTAKLAPKPAEAEEAVKKGHSMSRAPRLIDYAFLTSDNSPYVQFARGKAAIYFRGGAFHTMKELLTKVNDIFKDVFVYKDIAFMMEESGKGNVGESCDHELFFAVPAPKTTCTPKARGPRST